MTLGKCDDRPPNFDATGSPINKGGVSNDEYREPLDAAVGKALNKHRTQYHTAGYVNGPNAQTLQQLPSGDLETQGLSTGINEHAPSTMDEEIISLLSFSHRTNGSRSARSSAFNGGCNMQAFSRLPSTSDVSSFGSSCSAVLQHHRARMTDKLEVARVECGRKCINHYQVIKEIGRGACGKVKLAFDTENDILVAIKQVSRPVHKMRLGAQTPAQQKFSAFQREIAVMKKLRHKNIVPLYEVIDDPSAKKIFLVMMYIDGGPISRIRCSAECNLDEQVCEPIPARRLAVYLRQMLSGLDYLHKNKIVHRDIKPENILVSRNGHVYLVDFGVAEIFDSSGRERRERMMQESMTASRLNASCCAGRPIHGTKGTLLFIAPELWEGDRSYAKPVDMWAMGATVYILLTGRLPFCTLQDILNPQLPAIPTEYGKGWEELLRGMLNRDPKKRVTAQQAHAMVKKIIHGDADTEDPTECVATVTAEELQHALTMVNIERNVRGTSHLPSDSEGGEKTTPYFPRVPKHLANTVEKPPRRGNMWLSSNDERSPREPGSECALRIGRQWSSRTSRKVSVRSNLTQASSSSRKQTRTSFNDKVEFPSITSRGSVLNPLAVSNSSVETGGAPNPQVVGAEKTLHERIERKKGHDQPRLHTGSKQHPSPDKNPGCFPVMLGPFFSRSKK
uniref:Uncharacterized protein TCIL3000_11_7630 n=1 Tax=Trypanosoma congolense (strain IL3000) TaxID=1068625 RepID=G0V103_TRYCI|nr:unnamed protein product [Trypanosoma congolense IL3000]